MRNIKTRSTANDKIYTPLPVAEKMIDICNIQADEIVLDPCKGGGVFYDNLPPECKKKYCEIEENINFFDFNQKVDLIIGNPPYSIWNKWVDKSISLNPNKICYIWGLGNFTPARIEKFKNAGYGIKKIIFLTVDWWFSASWIVLFEKNYESIEIINIPRTINCPECNKRCGRGRLRKGVKLSPNKCQLIK